MIHKIGCSGHRVGANLVAHSIRTTIASACFSQVPSGPGSGVIDTGKKDEKGRAILRTDVDFQALRRTCATLFGDKAKDPKITQSQMRHADPAITLKLYQKSVPETVKAAAISFEADLISENSAGVLRGQVIQ